MYQLVAYFSTGAEERTTHATAEEAYETVESYRQDTRRLKCWFIAANGVILDQG